MAVYLGNFGRVTLRRKSDQGALESVINPSDVNTTRKRFSFDFDQGYLITGDQIEITSTNGATLAWVSTAGWANGTKQANGKWYVNVDELGGIRLYSSFVNAVNGGSANAIALDSIATDIPTVRSVPQPVVFFDVRLRSHQLPMGLQGLLWRRPA